MLNFKNIENLASQMFANLNNEDNLVSVIANKQIIIDIMVELLNYKNVILENCDLDYEEEYDREYIISLFDDTESDNWHVNIEKCYLTEKDKYVSTDGYVLFHEDVNSKAMIDMQNNEYTPLKKHDWFTVGKESLEDIDKDNIEDESTNSGYSVTVKVGLDSDEAGNMIRNTRKNFQKELSDMFGIPYRPLPLRFFW